jgi:hypothetical protein
MSKKNSMAPTEIKPATFWLVAGSIFSGDMAGY